MVKVKIAKAAKKVMVPVSIFEILFPENSFKKFITKNEVMVLLEKNRGSYTIDEMIERTRQPQGLFLQHDNVVVYGSRPRMS